MNRGPVVWIGGNHEDIPVETHLLAVVLADVWVIPIDAGIKETKPVGRVASDLHGGLCFMNTVVTVLDTQTVPMHRSLQVPFIDNVDDGFRSLRDLESRPWNGPSENESTSVRWRRSRVGRILSAWLEMSTN